MMTPKELGELGELERAAPHVDPRDLPEQAEDAILEPGLRKSVNLVRGFAAIPEHIRAEKRIAIEFDFFAQPVALIGEARSRRSRSSAPKSSPAAPTGTGETYRIPASLVVSCIGYRTTPIPDVPFDERAGRFANDEGRILPGLYCVGWARRGPSGTIGTNRPDGFAVVGQNPRGHRQRRPRSGGQGRARPASTRSPQARGLDVVTFRDWKKIEEAEEKAARDGAPREKFVDIEAMIRARR